MSHIVQDFVEACFNNVFQQDSVDRATAIQVVCLVFVFVFLRFDVSLSKSQLQGFCIFLLNLLATDVASDVVTAQWNHCQMAENVVLIHRYGGCICTKIYQYTSRTLFAAGQYGICQSERSNEVFCIFSNFDRHQVAALGYVFLYILAGNDVKEACFDVVGLYTYRFYNEIVAHFVFLGSNTQYLVTHDRYSTVAVLQ